MAYYRKSSARKKDDDKPRRPQSATSYVLWLLGQREYSAANLRKKLQQKEFSEEEIETAMAYVQSNNYQSDARYAQMHARSKAGKNGNFRIKLALKEKGIDEETIAAQMEELAPEDERACELVKKFAGQELTPELNQKIYRFMAYRGFSGRAIKVAIQSLKEPAD